MTRSTAFKDSKVAAVFGAYPAELRAKLLALRRLILDTARSLDGVGPLDETLKWGQPSYLTQSKSGSTIRIDALKGGDGYAMYVHCQTDLVETFRELYPTQMSYGGNRSILFKTNDRLPQKALAHCIGLALTYRARQKQTTSGKTAMKKTGVKKAGAKRRARPS